MGLFYLDTVLVGIEVERRVVSTFSGFRYLEGILIGGGGLWNVL